MSDELSDADAAAAANDWRWQLFSIDNADALLPQRLVNW